MSLVLFLLFFVPVMSPFVLVRYFLLGFGVLPKFSFLETASVEEQYVCPASCLGTLGNHGREFKRIYTK